MTNTTHSAQDDLAFMRALVEGGGGGGGGVLPKGFGEVYIAGGLLYGLQTLGHAFQAAGVFAQKPLEAMALGFGPTIVFIVFIVWFSWRMRGLGRSNLASRAVGATFGCIGVANLALICAIGSVAITHRSLTIWLIYPCVVLIMQGAAWLIAFSLSRRPWAAAVGLGWFAIAIGMALNIDQVRYYLLFLAVGLIGLMAGSGAVIMRLARKPA